MFFSEFEFVGRERENWKRYLEMREKERGAECIYSDGVGAMCFCWLPTGNRPLSFILTLSHYYCYSALYFFLYHCSGFILFIFIYVFPLDGC